MKYYRCGHILKTFGIKGELKVENLSDFDRFEKGKRVYILHNENYIEVTISKKRETNGYLYIAFENMEDINLVEKYHGDYLYISEEDREELDEGEYYYDEIIGKKVINQNGEEKGICKDILDLPSCRYLAIDVNGKEKLVPMIDEFIIEINDDNIIVNEIEGLFWR